MMNGFDVHVKIWHALMLMEPDLQQLCKHASQEEQHDHKNIIEVLA